MHRNGVVEKSEIKILALSGSLRAQSTNTTLLEVAAALEIPGVKISLYRGLSKLPHFNPDLKNNLPAEVQAFRTEIQACAGMLISTPEYAHGIPGTLKNALDWLVAGTEFIGKPVTLLNASSRGIFAQNALVETLRTMSGNVILEAVRTVELMGKDVNPQYLPSDPSICAAIRECLEVFSSAILTLQPVPVQTDRRKIQDAGSPFAES